MEQITTTEAADVLGVDTSTVRRLIKDKKLAATQYGPRLQLIDRAEVDRLIAERGTQTRRGWRAGRKRKGNGDGE